MKRKFPKSSILHFIITLKKFLISHEIYIIIGYSFRDFSVNQALYYGLRNNRSSRMIVVTSNNNVRNQVNQFFAEFASQRNKIEFVGTRFGENNFIPELRNVLE